MNKGFNKYDFNKKIRPKNGTHLILDDPNAIRVMVTVS